MEPDMINLHDLAIPKQMQRKILASLSVQVFRVGVRSGRGRKKILRSQDSYDASSFTKEERVLTQNNKAGLGSIKNVQCTKSSFATLDSTNPICFKVTFSSYSYILRFLQAWVHETYQYFEQLVISNQLTQNENRYFNKCFWENLKVTQLTRSFRIRVKV